MIRRLIQLIGLALLLVLAAGYGGAWLPAGDSLSVARLYVIAGLIVLGLGCLMTRMRGWAFIFLIPAVAAFAHLATEAQMRHGRGYSDYALYQKNMLFRMPDPARLGEDILGHAPDFVTLQEVSGVNMAIFDTLGARYPATLQCPFQTVGGVAVASRWPVIAGTETCVEKGGLAAMQVLTPDGPVWIVSIHLHWPWPYSQAEQAARIEAVLAGLEGRKVIGGDFNMVPWSYRVRHIAQTAQTGLIGRPMVTLTKARGLLRVQIDHVMVTGGLGETQRLPLLGSDHFGVLAHFSLPDLDVPDGS